MITGATEQNGKYYCENCGADLSVEGSVEMTMHIVGIDFYQTNYRCTNCSNIIEQREKREEAWI